MTALILGCRAIDLTSQVEVTLIGRISDLEDGDLWRVQPIACGTDNRMQETQLIAPIYLQYSGEGISNLQKEPDFTLMKKVNLGDKVKDNITEEIGMLTAFCITLAGRVDCKIESPSEVWSRSIEFISLVEKSKRVHLKEVK